MSSEIWEVHSFEEAKARYGNTLRKVCEANVIEFADLLLICDLAYLICSPVQNSHYPPCDVCQTLYQEYKNRMNQ